MTHVIIYCSFEKLQNGPVHVIAENYQIFYDLKIPTVPRRMFNSSSNDSRYEIAPVALLDLLAKNGFHLISNSTIGSNSSHTLQYV